MGEKDRYRTIRRIIELGPTSQVIGFGMEEFPNVHPGLNLIDEAVESAPLNSDLKDHVRETRREIALRWTRTHGACAAIVIVRCSRCRVDILNRKLTYSRHDDTVWLS